MVSRIFHERRSRTVTVILCVCTYNKESMHYTYYIIVSYFNDKCLLHSIFSIDIRDFIHIYICVRLYEVKM